MSRMMTGFVTIVQEGRFQMADADGVSHLFILGPLAAVEPEQLAALQRRQARIIVQYEPLQGLIGNAAKSIFLAD